MSAIVRRSLLGIVLWIALGSVPARAQPSPEVIAFDRLYAELKDWNDRDARKWAAHLRPLASLFLERTMPYLRTLAEPMRVGTLANPAYALKLLHDQARLTNDAALASLVAERGRKFFADDYGCAPNVEVSGADFFSPCLVEAALVGAIMPRAHVTRGQRGALAIVAGFATVLTSRPVEAQDHVSFSTPDKAIVRGDLYGAGKRGIVLVAHGGYSSKEKWAPQARILAKAGFRVLAFDTRAGWELEHTGKETDCLYDPACMAIDVLAAIRYLRESGATTVSVVGGSAGGGAVAQASVDAKPGEVDRIVLLAPMPIPTPERMKGRKLFIATRDDRSGAGPRLPGIREQYERAPDPKDLVVLEGSAHGQLIFETPDGERLTREILAFVSRP
jgi:dienelactone hydrolase